MACTCDICDSARYAKLNYLRVRQVLMLHENMDVNKYGFRVYRPPKLETRSFSRRPEVMRLIRTAIEYLDRTWEYMND
jgi:hypothetical protein